METICDTCRFFHRLCRLNRRGLKFQCKDCRQIQSMNSKIRRGSGSDYLIASLCGHEDDKDDKDWEEPIGSQADGWPPGNENKPIINFPRG